MPNQPIDGHLRDPLRKFRFHVTITPPPGSNLVMGKLHFSEVSGLRSETEVVEYKAGDDPLHRKIPGQTTFDNIVLSKGVDTNGVLVAWRRLVIENQAGDVRETDIRGKIVIDLYDRRGRSLRRSWIVKSAWPTILEVDDLSGDSSDILIERAEFACEEQIEAVFAA